MGQKVWVIDDKHLKEPPRRSRIDGPAPARREPDSRPLPQPKQKSPAVSFSLSMLVWGGGQMYAGSYGPGSIFMAAMLFFYATLSALVFFREPASRILAWIDLPKSILVSGGLAFVAAGLFVWLASAVDAYWRASRLRSEPFLGVGNGFSPFFCSMFFPGWGQFLNGQPGKGTFFLLFGMTGFLSAVTCTAIRCVWPVLRASPARSLAEGCLAVALLLIPISLLMWIVAAYDSLGARREIAEKRLQPLPAGYRQRSRGSMRSLVPRSTAVLCLLLAISVGMQSIPEKYYRDSLETLRAEAMSGGMEVIPELIQEVIDYVG